MPFQWSQLWRKHKKLLLGALSSVVLLALLGALASGWYWYRWQLSLEASRDYRAIVQLLEERHDSQALVSLNKMIESAPNGYGVLSLLKKGMFLELDDTQGSIALYEETVAKVSEPSLKDFLHVRLALLLMEDPLVNRSAIESYLLPIRDARLHPLRPMAMELWGYLVYRLGESQEALRMFTQILDNPSAPPAMRGRARIMKAALLSQEPWPSSKPSLLEGAP